jgi:hypothetical protein
MGLEDGIVVFGADPLARKRLGSVERLAREGFGDAEFAGQHVAMENHSGGVGDTLIGAGILS